MPVKKAVSISMPRTRPAATPRRRMAWSKGAELWRRVSQPSYQAPVGTKTPGREMGAVGLVRSVTGEKKSSEWARWVLPRAEEMRSGAGR